MKNGACVVIEAPVFARVSAVLSRVPLQGLRVLSLVLALHFLARSHLNLNLGVAQKHEERRGVREAVVGIVEQMNVAVLDVIPSRSHQTRYREV